MKMLKTLALGILAFLLVFTFLPTGQDGNAVVDNFLATTSYSTSFTRSGAQLTTVYVAASFSAEDNEDVANLTKNIVAHGGFSDFIYDYTETTDPYGATVKTCNPLKPNSDFGDYRTGYGGYHGGEDMQPAEGRDGYCLWQCAFFSGTVRESFYDRSWGRTVLVESDAVPGLYFRYAHMGPGHATVHGGVMPNWQKQLQYPNGESITLKGQSPTQYELDNGYKGYDNGSSTWAGGGVLVKVGDHVDAGQRIGILGTTGSSEVLHTHMELYLAIDPSGVLKGYEANGNRVMYPNYRTGAYAVISSRSFENSKWLYYVNKQSCGSDSISAEEAMELLESGFGANAEDSFVGGE